MTELARNATVGDIITIPPANAYEKYAFTYSLVSIPRLYHFKVKKR